MSWHQVVLQKREVNGTNSSTGHFKKRSQNPAGFSLEPIQNHIFSLFFCILGCNVHTHVYVYGDLVKKDAFSNNKGH